MVTNACRWGTSFSDEAIPDGVAEVEELTDGEFGRIRGKVQDERPQFSQWLINVRQNHSKVIAIPIPRDNQRPDPENEQGDCGF